MDTVVSEAVNICSTMYAAVGLFGYIAFHDVDLNGDILLYLQSSLLTQLLKLAFMLSVAVSIPLMLFPSRIAFYNLLLKSVIFSTAVDWTVSRITRMVVHETRLRKMFCLNSRSSEWNAKRFLKGWEHKHQNGLKKDPWFLWELINDAFSVHFEGFLWIRSVTCAFVSICFNDDVSLIFVFIGCNNYTKWYVYTFCIRSYHSGSIYQVSFIHLNCSLSC